MPKKRRSKPNKASSTRNWETDDSATFSGGAIVRSTGLPQPVSFTRQILSKHKPMSGNARKGPDGWRLPTNFQAYVCKMVPMGPFDYKSSATSTSQHYGSSGFCPPNVNTQGIFLGCSGAGHFPRTSTSLENRCITEALNKLKDGDINVAETLATMNQTLSLIASVASRMKDLYDLLHAKQLARQAMWDRARDAYYASVGRGGSRSAQRKRIFFRQWGVPQKRPPSDWFRRKAGGLWLELQYGWKPLVSDIQGALSGALNDRPPPAIKAVRHLEENGPLPGGLGNLSGPPYIHSVSGEVRSGCHVRLDAVVTNANLAALDSLSLVNPFSLGWELLPFSFVIDWLIPIGNAIKGLSASCGLTARGQSVTLYTVANVDILWTQYTYSSGTMIHGRINSLSTWRKAYTGFSLPRLYIKSPFTTTRAVTALALLTALR